MHLDYLPFGENAANPAIEILFRGSLVNYQVSRDNTTLEPVQSPFDLPDGILPLISHFVPQHRRLDYAQWMKLENWISI